MKKNSFVEGTIIASISIIIVKILGALYVIPFYSIIGKEGGTLYSYAYNVYSLLLNISTSGIPIAISKIISEYAALEEFESKEKTYKLGKKIIFMLSIISFFILFVFSREFAYIFIGNLKGGSNINDISLVLKAVSFCLLIVPFLSLTRGYLQGHKYIEDSSKSQIIEQVIRIAVVLMGSYLAINVFNSSVTTGVAVAVSGAFFGALGAYLFLKYKKDKNKDKFLSKQKSDKKVATNKEILKRIIRYCIPIIIVSVSVNIYSITDQSLVIRGLSHLGYSTMDSEIIASIISTWGIKICIIINAIATGISISLMPYMTASRALKDKKEINSKFNQALSVIFGVTLPLAIGICILSTGVYTLFYGASEYGGIILKILVFTSFFSSLDIVIDVALQGLNRFKIIYLCTIAGFATNAALDIPLMYLCAKIGIYPFYGAIFATIIGYIISLSISIGCVAKDEKIDFRPLFDNIKKLILPIICMAIPVIILNHFISLEGLSRIKLFLVLLSYALIGGSIYFVLLLKNKGFSSIFGEEYYNKVMRIINKVFKRGNKNA